ncbi:MAG: ParA family protein [Nitriliruptoraceae bacterium]|nr:ParA family protein [Nitriliruptoraceae bacterium]
MHTVASYHLKGGVGKTTTAVAVAVQASLTGARTLLWDLDPLGAATRLAGAERAEEGHGWLGGPQLDLDRVISGTPQDGLDILPAARALRRLDRDESAAATARSRVRAVLAGAQDRYDVLVVDCPPAVSALTPPLLGAADVVLAPLTAGPLAWSAYADLAEEVDAVAAGSQDKLLAFLTMVDRRKRLHRDLVDDLAEGTEGFSTVYVPTDSSVERMALDEAPLRAVRTGRAATAYATLTAELLGRRAA